MWVIFAILFWISSFIVVNCFIDGNLTPEGCERGWIHFNNLCYEFNVHDTDFILAKDICITKDATLVSIWSTAEADHIINTLWTDQNIPAKSWRELMKEGVERSERAWIGVSTDPDDTRNRINWLDGSYFDGPEKELPPEKKCGAISGTGEQIFVECENPISAFICKKPLKMAYVVTEIFNLTYISTYQNEVPDKLLFERVWPPKLQEVPRYLEKIATAQVSKETDCAYRCFHIDNCRGFTLTCISMWKCNQFNCDLYEPSHQ